MPSDRLRYPVTIYPSNETYDALVGGARILVLNATPNVDNLDSSSFLSIMTVNISTLQGVGVSNISCGLFFMMSTLTVSFNPKNGWSLYSG